jgi:hypothetical protein
MFPSSVPSPLAPFTLPADTETREILSKRSSYAQLQLSRRNTSTSLFSREPSSAEVTSSRPVTYTGSSLHPPYYSNGDVAANSDHDTNIRRPESLPSKLSHNGQHQHRVWDWGEGCPSHLTDTSSSLNQSGYIPSVSASTMEQGETPDPNRNTLQLHSQSQSQPVTPTPLPKKIIFVLSIVLFSEPMSLTILFPFVYFMVRDFGMADEKDIGFYVGFIASAFSMAQFLTSLLWGWYAFLQNHTSINLSISLMKICAYMGTWHCTFL